MKKLLISIFVVIAVAIAGKFGLEYQYKKTLNKWIQQASLFADISYGQLFFDFKGNLNIKNISFKNSSNNVDIALDNLQVYSSDKSLFLKGFDSIKNGEFPESFKLVFNQVSFDTKSTLQVNANRECRYIDENLELGNFINSQVSIDLIMNFESKGENHFKTELQTFTKGISELSAEFVLDKSLLNSPLSAGQGKDLPIKNIQITNTVNQSYADKALTYCAQKLNISKDAYLNDIVGGDKYYKALKITPSKELKLATQSHFSGKSTITLKAEPNSTGRNINSLALYKPKQIIQVLNLEIEEDGKKIPNLLGTPSATLDQSLSTDKSDATQQTATQNKPNAKEAKKFYGRRAFTFQQIKVNEIKNHIGKTAKVTRRKRQLDGEILSVKNNVVKFNNKQFGGSTIMSLPTSEITKIEIKVFSNQ